MTDTQDILFLSLSVAAIFITIFLCWALYELATLLRRSNEIVADVQLRIAQIEQMAVSVKEKILNPLSYLGVLAGGGKTVFSMLKKYQEGKEGKKKGKRKSELFDE